MLKSLGQWIVVIVVLALLIGGGALIGERVRLGAGPVVGLVLLVAVLVAARLMRR
jgi:hypothetical protein